MQRKKVRLEIPSPFQHIVGLFPRKEPHNHTAAAMGTTKTIKNKHSSKHAANGSGVKGSKQSKYGDKGDGVIKAKKNHLSKAPIPGQGVKGRPKISDILKKRKQRVYSEKELGIPELNKITPVGVTKPKGKKKGKIFVDDRVCFGMRNSP